MASQGNLQDKQIKFMLLSYKLINPKNSFSYIHHYLILVIMTCIKILFQNPKRVGLLMIKNIRRPNLSIEIGTTSLPFLKLSAEPEPCSV